MLRREGQCDRQREYSYRFSTDSRENLPFNIKRSNKNPTPPSEEPLHFRPLTKIIGTYFCPFLWVGAAGAAVLSDQTWAYSWDWSVPIRCEDAPYTTKKSGGQSGEKQLGMGGGGGRLMEGAEPGHVTPTSQCEETEAASN